MDILTTRFIPKGEFVARVIAGETILVPIRDQVGDLNAIYNLNEVGTFIWQRLDGHANVKQILEAVNSEFEVAAEDAERDIEQFIHSLNAAGVIEPVGEGT